MSSTRKRGPNTALLTQNLQRLLEQRKKAQTEALKAYGQDSTPANANRLVNAINLTYSALMNIELVAAARNDSKNATFTKGFSEVTKNFQNLKTKYPQLEDLLTYEDFRSIGRSKAENDIFYEILNKSTPPQEILTYFGVTREPSMPVFEPEATAEYEEEPAIPVLPPQQPKQKTPSPKQKTPSPEGPSLLSQAANVAWNVTKGTANLGFTAATLAAKAGVNVANRTRSALKARAAAQKAAAEAAEAQQKAAQVAEAAAEAPTQAAKASLELSAEKALKTAIAKTIKAEKAEEAVQTVIPQTIISQTPVPIKTEKVSPPKQRSPVIKSEKQETVRFNIPPPPPTLPLPKNPEQRAAVQEGKAVVDNVMKMKPRDLADNTLVEMHTYKIIRIIESRPKTEPLTPQQVKQIQCYLKEMQAFMLKSPLYKNANSRCIIYGIVRELVKDYSPRTRPLYRTAYLLSCAYGKVINAPRVAARSVARGVSTVFKTLKRLFTRKSKATQVKKGGRTTRGRKHHKRAH
jgi:hypothetical protein